MGLPFVFLSISGIWAPCLHNPLPSGVNSTSSTLTDYALRLAYRHGSDEGCCGAEAEEAEDDGDDDATMMMMYEDGFALDGMTVEGYMNSPEEATAEPETIIPLSCIIAVLTWEVEATVRRAQTTQPDPDTRPPNAGFTPDAEATPKRGLSANP
ncbi:unnamed protein product [Pleuronectes platessa]|uniref:Uncharacterized protein n=1 Tax=Pleuronectes platessa TaxID=8262 RepID=A0A9N7Z5T5_PLEPL|nr:unnamed protein product [Pleuronectes platessa]